MRYWTVADSHAPAVVALAAPAPSTGTATVANVVAASTARVLECCERDKMSLCEIESVGGDFARVTDADGDTDDRSG
jgi:hypothetical protein